MCTADLVAKVILYIMCALLGHKVFSCGDHLLGADALCSDVTFIIYLLSEQFVN